MAIGLGVIGFGARCRDLMRRIPGSGRDFVMCSVCDPDSNCIAIAKEQFNRDVVVYEDYRALVEDPGIDWVFVGSWNALHHDHAVAALRAGKDVFCEKPPAISVEQCVDIGKAAAESGRRFVIGFVLRYSPHYIKIKELVDSGEIGSIISMEFNETLSFNHGGFIHGDWRRLTKNAGTYLLEKCCHDIDLANWIVGARARRVASFGGLSFFIPKNEYHISRLGKDPQGNDAYCTFPCPDRKNPFLADKDIADNQVAIIEYDDNARAAFHTNCNAGIPERRMYILGSEGAIRSDVISGSIELARIGFQETVKQVSAGVSGEHGGADDLMVKEWVRIMLRGGMLPTGIGEAMASAITCFGIDKAMETGEVVDMKQLWEMGSR